MDRLRVCIAGSTHHTVWCAEALAQDERFECVGVLTPEPKPVGRHRVLTPNPLQRWAEHHQLPIVTITDNISLEIRAAVQAVPKPDLLLVVDFGYFIPDWLLRWANIAPVNIHPSQLPRWRGASPGQFTLLSGETVTAVSVIIMTDQLDAGPIIFQLPLTVAPIWTTEDFYARSFANISKVLPDILSAFAKDPGQISPQEPDSPTPMARRLTKADGFIPWSVVQSCLDGAPHDEEVTDMSPLLAEFAKTTAWPVVIERATRALQPWPTLWTMIPTAGGPKRMQIPRARVENTKLILEDVKIEGSHTAKWNDVKNTVR